LLKKVVKPENIAFSYWIAIRVISKGMVFEVPIFDSGADAIKKFTPSLGIPYLRV